MYSLTCSDSVSYILSIKISQTSNKHRLDNGYKCEISEISLTTGENCILSGWMLWITQKFWNMVSVPSIKGASKLLKSSSFILSCRTALTIHTITKSRIKFFTKEPNLFAIIGWKVQSMYVLISRISWLILY